MQKSEKRCRTVKRHNNFEISFQSLTNVAIYPTSESQDSLDHYFFNICKKSEISIKIDP